MGRRIVVEIAGCTPVEVRLDDVPTAGAIAAALPLEAEARRWGDEVYFSLPVDAPAGREVDAVEVGDVAWWVPGKAFCLFFGPTPVSDDRIRPASPVTVVGRVVGDPRALRATHEGAKVRLHPL